MNYYFYILHSKIKDKYYIGYTSNLQDRIKKHNTNHQGYTGYVNDWKLVYTEEYSTKEKASERERQLKKWKNTIRIRSLIFKGSEHPD
ncbi:MAG: GIY-YIG nuclease family protein [Bacteroidetes bacterium]|nr:GIY-YIG nuclease family protein [Bacteroidota bacterium]